MKIMTKTPNFSVKRLPVTILLSSLAMNSVQAAGLQLMPGSPNFATAGAGHAALGEGAGSAWANPASMSLLEGNHLAVGIIAAKTDIQFDATDSTLDSGDNAGGSVFLPSFSYAHSLTDDVKLGFSLVVPYGSDIAYDSDWAGKNVVTKTGMHTLQAMPSLSFRFNDQLSLGGGITINHTQVYQDLSPTLTLGRVSQEADLSLEAESVDYGWTLGGLYEFNARHRVGIVYRSGIEADLEGDAEIVTTGLIDLDETLDAELNWENASNIVISGYHEVNNEWAMMWDIGRTFYSEFEQTDIVATGLGEAPITLEVERNWQDANRYALGTHYKLNDKLTLQAGFSYDESVVTDEHRSADLPLDDIKRYTLGSLYQVTEAVQLGFGIEYAQLGSGNIEEPIEGELLDSPQGSYESSAVATSFSMNYQF